MTFLMELVGLSTNRIMIFFVGTHDDVSHIDHYCNGQWRSVTFFLGGCKSIIYQQKLLSL